MTSIINFATSIAIIIIIHSLIDALTAKSKFAGYIKKVLFLIVIVIILNFIMNFNINLNDEFNFSSESIDTSQIWENTLKRLSGELENQIYKLCRENGLSINSCSVQLETDFNEINIKNIILKGRDKMQAKNLISGYFKINSAYINTDGV